MVSTSGADSGGALSPILMGFEAPFDAGHEDSMSLNAMALRVILKLAAFERQRIRAESR
jgi:hypothetical protein